MGFSKQEYWSELSCPPPGDLPHPGIEPTSPTLQADSLLLSHWGSPNGREGGIKDQFESFIWEISFKNEGDSRRKEILKIRAEINAKETKETIAKINS